MRGIMNTTTKLLRSAALFVAGIALVLPALLPQTASAVTLFPLGQTHSYDTQLRGDGSAVVNARLDLTNNEDTAQKVYKYSAASGTLSDILAFQEIQCADLPPYIPLPVPDASTQSATAAPSETKQTVNGEAAITATDLPECYPEVNKYTTRTTESGKATITYYQPDYRSFYKKITVKQDGNSFTLTLPEELKSSEDTTVVLVYNLTGVAKKHLGVYNYDFKTLKTNNRVSQSTVAISVDNNYVLEGSADDTINYKTGGTKDIAESLKNGSNLSVSDNSAISSYVGSIGNNGTVTKTATNLAPQETLNVTGRYATNEFLLHWPRTVLRVALVVLLIGLCVSWYRRHRKQLRKKQWSQLPVAETHAPSSQAPVAPAKSESKDGSIVPPATVVAVSAPAKSSVVNINLQALPFYSYFQARRLSSAAFGWLCALIAGLFIGGIVWAITMLDNSSYYGYGGGTDAVLAIVATLSLMAAGFLGFLLITIGLPFLYAPTFKSALKIIANVVLTFIVVTVVLAVIINVFDTQQEPDYPSYDPYYIQPQ